MPPGWEKDWVVTCWQILASFTKVLLFLWLNRKNVQKLDLSTLWDFARLINFWSHSTESPPFSGLWLVKQFSHIHRQTYFRLTSNVVCELIRDSPGQITLTRTDYLMAKLFWIPTLICPYSDLIPNKRCASFDAVFINISSSFYNILQPLVFPNLYQIWPMTDYIYIFIFAGIHQTYSQMQGLQVYVARIILCMRPVNDRQCYNVMLPLIGCVHTQNDPCVAIADCSCLNSCFDTMFLSLFLKYYCINVFLFNPVYCLLFPILQKAISLLIQFSVG